MKRIIGRLVYRPAGYRSSRTGFNYRDITARRLSYRFCWIEGDLSQIEDWGTLRQSVVGGLLCRLGFHSWSYCFYWERQCRRCPEKQSYDAKGFGDTLHFEWVSRDWTKDPLP